MVEDKFLHTDIYINYKDTTIVVVCSDDKEKVKKFTIEMDESAALWYYKVKKRKFSSLVFYLLNKEIKNDHEKDSKYFYIDSELQLQKVFMILDQKLNK